MFLKTGEMKKIMKSSLKKHGLIVGNVNEHYLVYSDEWGVYVEHPFASNKFKAAIMELIGNLPEPGECYFYTYGDDKKIMQQSELNYPDPYELWKMAKDYGTMAPLYLFAWPHEYVVYQRASDLQFVIALRDLTTAVISPSELDNTCEHMPGRPSILSGKVLYYKNESTIYWVHTESPGSRVEEVLFPSMKRLDFFEDDWVRKVSPDEFYPPESDVDDRDDNAADEQLPY